MLLCYLTLASLCARWPSSKARFLLLCVISKPATAGPPEDSSSSLDNSSPPAELFAASHEHKKLVLQLLRAQPLLSELPAALGTVLGRERGLNPNSFDPLEYLRANFAPRVREYNIVLMQQRVRVGQEHAKERMNQDRLRASSSKF